MFGHLVFQQDWFDEFYIFKILLLGLHLILGFLGWILIFQYFLASVSSYDFLQLNVLQKLKSTSSGFCLSVCVL